MKKYPVGATWEGHSESGIRARVVLSETLIDTLHGKEPLDIWNWSILYSDGTTVERDWARTYVAARREAITRLTSNLESENIRFKRIK